VRLPETLIGLAKVCVSSARFVRIVRLPCVCLLDWPELEFVQHGFNAPCPYCASHFPRLGCFGHSLGKLLCKSCKRAVSAWDIACRTSSLKFGLKPCLGIQALAWTARLTWRPYLPDGSRRQKDSRCARDAAAAQHGPQWMLKDFEAALNNDQL
jgi:hypothetical protein